jgi:hypothetical protein
LAKVSIQRGPIPNNQPPLVSLWDDNPTDVDLLGFASLLAPITAAIDAGELDPLTIGIHGRWGTGKSTLLRLLESHLATHDDYVVISTSPWEYEDHDDVKGILIGVVLDGLEQRAKGTQAWVRRAKKQIGSLMKRVDWARVGPAAVKAGITMGANIDEVVKALSLRPIEPRTMVRFRSDFGKLLEDIPTVSRVIVLIDDLDRCLPRAVVPTLEALKLFLSVPKMVFVVAADRDLVADAIAAYLPPSNRSERIANYYLEKIIQLPISLPQIPAHDAEAFIGLLLLSRTTGTSEHLQNLVLHCNNRRLNGEAPLLSGFSADAAFAPDEATLRLTAQVALGLGPETWTNPRMIKRFLNTFGVRRYIAQARGIDINPAVLAKMIILEERFPDAFDKLMSRNAPAQSDLLRAWEEWAGAEELEPPDGATEALKSWAASEPTLANEELGPYLTLAGSLAAKAVRVAIDEELATIVRRMVGDSEADRELAYEDALARSPQERRQIVQGLDEQLRRATDIGRPTRALVAVAERDDDLSSEVVARIRAVDRSLFTAGIVVTIGASKSGSLRGLGGELLAEGKISNEAKNALKEVLE